MRELVTTQTLHDEVADILMADTILDTSALAPLGDEGQGDCALHDGCRPIT